MLKSLRIIKYFSFTELIIFFCGKILSISNSKLGKVQEKADSLYLLMENGINLKVNQNDIEVDSYIDADLYNLKLRLEGSDTLVFSQVIVHRDYESLVGFYNLKFKKSPKNIIDAGANVGLTTIYFKSKYPEATVYLIEPVQANFALAKRNIETNSISSVIFFNGALWPKSESLRVINDFRDLKDWSLRVESNPEGDIESVTPFEIINKLGGVIDIFKIDIEGSENQLFSEEMDLTWLHQVRVIAIEIHDEFLVRTRIMEVLKRSNFELTSSGELIIGLNKDYE